MRFVSPVDTRCPADLSAAIRGAIARHADWRETAALVAEELRMHLPGPQILTARERAGSPAGYVCNVLHTELLGQARQAA